MKNTIKTLILAIAITFAGVQPITEFHNVKASTKSTTMKCDNGDPNFCLTGWILTSAVVEGCSIWWCRCSNKVIQCCNGGGCTPVN